MTTDGNYAKYRGNKQGLKKIYCHVLARTFCVRTSDVTKRALVSKNFWKNFWRGVNFTKNGVIWLAETLHENRIEKSSEFKIDYSN
jgi:hypothetical protein